MGMADAFYKGKLQVRSNECNLELSLLGGQSFRWNKYDGTDHCEYIGVAKSVFFTLTQSSDTIHYKALPAPSASITPNEGFFANLLQEYLRLEFDLAKYIEEWKSAHKHFASISTNLKAVRVLNQEPLENIISFICSQNNNIKRISSMLKWFCSAYGEQICRYKDENYFSFPTLESLLKQDKLESQLREAKFGYRAKFISDTVKTINEKGGEKWLQSLCNLTYEEARNELHTLPGIGPKVADCICLMSLNHLEAVPIDTHIYKVAKSCYLPELSNVKSVTPAVYAKISKYFRGTYGRYAGWAQAVLFCSELQQFNRSEGESTIKLKSNMEGGNKIKAKKKRS